VFLRTTANRTMYIDTQAGLFAPLYTVVNVHFLAYVRTIDISYIKIWLSSTRRCSYSLGSTEEIRDTGRRASGRASAGQRIQDRYWHEGRHGAQCNSKRPVWPSTPARSHRKATGSICNLQPVIAVGQAADTRTNSSAAPMPSGICTPRNPPEPAHDSESWW